MGLRVTRMRGGEPPAPPCAARENILFSAPLRTSLCAMAGWRRAEKAGSDTMKNMVATLPIFLSFGNDTEGDLLFRGDDTEGNLHFADMTPRTWQQPCRHSRALVSVAA